MTAHCDDVAGIGGGSSESFERRTPGREVRTVPRAYGDLIAAMRLSARREGVRLG